MKLVEKIQNVRVDMAAQNLKPTGNNEYAGYGYFELDDFTVQLNEAMLKHRITAIPSFNAQEATLTVYDMDSDQTAVITSPFGSANLKGCHAVQNIGAVETYQRRYLYQAMFDITEKDALNKSHGKPEDKNDSKPRAPKAQEQKQPDNKPQELSRKQTLNKCLRDAGFSPKDKADYVRSFCERLHGSNATYEDLNDKQFNDLLLAIRDMGNGNNGDA
jgi:hypothetical protein